MWRGSVQGASLTPEVVNFAASAYAKHSLYSLLMYPVRKKSCFCIFKCGANKKWLESDV